MTSPLHSTLPDPTATPEADHDVGQAQKLADTAPRPPGWNAYDVWRKRVLTPPTKGYKDPHGDS